MCKQHDFHHVINLTGGMTGYGAAGRTKEYKSCATPLGSRYFTGYRKNPLNEVYVGEVKK